MAFPASLGEVRNFNFYGQAVIFFMMDDFHTKVFHCKTEEENA
jgi:hypothetical protein